MTTPMRCLELQERGGDLVGTERPIPSIDSTEVLIEIAATGVGQSVYNKLYRADRITEEHLPLIPGHEIVGTIVETGDAVSHVEPGDLVTPHYYLLCGHCAACVSQREQWCEHSAGQIGVEVDGGYAEYVRLPGASTIKLPDGIDPVEATVISDAVGTPYHICQQRTVISAGDTVMVLGAGGGVGIHLVQMVRLFGAEVTAVDLSDRKLDACRDVGAEYAIDTREQSVAEAAAALGVEYDVIADFTGSKEVVSDALETLGARGRFVNLTTVIEGMLPVTPDQLVADEIEVVGSRYCSRSELMEVSELVASQAIEPIIDEVVELDDVPDLLDRIMQGEVVGRGAVRL